MIDFLFGLLMCLGLLTFILSFSTFITIYKLGFHGYTSHLRSLLNFKVDGVYHYDQVVTYTFGNSQKQIKERYYLFVNIKSDKEVTVLRCMENFFSFFNVEYFRKEKKENVDTWLNEDFKFKASCIILSLLRDRVSAKIEKSISDSIKISSSTNVVDEFINSEVKRISRDKKMSKVLS